MKDRDSSDPELDATLADGSNFHLAMARENNRHAEANAQRELGLFGRLFGGEKSAPTFVAMIAMIFALLGAGVAMAMAAANAETAPFWGTQVERLIAFAGASLAFIFGRGSKSS